MSKKKGSNMSAWCKLKPIAPAPTTGTATSTWKAASSKPAKTKVKKKAKAEPVMEVVEPWTGDEFMEIPQAEEEATGWLQDVLVDDYDETGSADNSSCVSEVSDSEDTRSESGTSHKSSSHADFTPLKKTDRDAMRVTYNGPELQLEEESL